VEDSKQWEIKPIRLRPGIHPKMKFLAAVQNKSISDVLGGLIDAEMERVKTVEIRDLVSNFDSV